MGPCLSRAVVLDASPLVASVEDQYHQTHRRSLDIHKERIPYNDPILVTTMDNELVCCTVCQERYTYDAKPRQLSCGHSVCTNCARELVLKSRMCPECRQGMGVTAFDDLPVNYPLLRLISSLPPSALEQSSFSTESTQTPFPDINYNRESFDQCERVSEVYSASLSDSDISAGYCKTHGNSMLHHCMPCKIFLCEQCVSDTHKVNSQTDCRILPVGKALWEMKNEQLKTSTRKETDLQEVKDIVNVEIQMMAMEISQHEMFRQQLLEKLKEEEEKIRILEDKKNTALVKDKKVQYYLEKIKKKKSDIKSVRTVDDVLFAVQASVEVIDRSRMIEKQIKIPHLAAKLGEGTQILAKIMEMDESIYAEHELGGGDVVWAKVTRQNRCAYLHALDHLTPPTNAYTIQWSSVKALVDKEYPLSFLDIQAGKSRGRIHLRMFENNGRARQFLLLCSGERRHSYKNVHVWDVWRKGKPGEHIVIWGPKNRDGTAVGPLVPESELSAPSQEREIVPGLVRGYFNTIGLCIFLQEDPEGKCSTAYGEVTAGLETLKEAALHCPVSDLVVVDCGLVINL